MKLIIEKQTTEITEIDMELPAYFESYGMQAMIKENGEIVKVSEICFFIGPKDGFRYQKEIQEIISSKKSTKEQFEETLSKLIETLSATIGRPLEIHSLTETAY